MTAQAPNITCRSITEMQNRPTSYEVALFVDDDSLMTLAYVQKRTSKSLLSICEKHGDWIATLLSEDELDAPIHISTESVSFGPGRVAVGFSGDTERDHANAKGKI